jgi:hypothetical protein
MATIINKELALKIVEKLKAKKIASKNKAHDEYSVMHGTHLIAIISIRRGSSKELGHDYIPGELHISPGQAKRLGQCPWKVEQFLAHLRERNLLPPDPEQPQQPNG